MPKVGKMSFPYTPAGMKAAATAKGGKKMGAKKGCGAKRGK